ncbi:HAD family hydrolase [Ornithinibacillus halophilus]|uniref:HAD-superfamily subfamily IB hydrolase, TIGR01490 n=1 Tax=Ornithinibacillus halophilus TaxID=930117 RepID=A0A1M5IG53_9BACI|nr:HAD family hydrolase [Ornithinibacillus halophilus]SHG27364.1 HAD-superfamily subfamily IB hydrolase, TIGR01490 [Ornithinibacillus halophilus]
MGLVTVDFDGTLFKGNSFKIMFQVAKKDFKLREWLVVAIGLVKAIVIGVFQGKEKFRHAFFKAFAKSFKGKSKEELEHFFIQLVDIGKKEVNYELIHKLRQHEKDGDTVIVVSGALMPFLTAFTKEVNLSVQVIGTELKYDKNGICNGQIGTIVNGEVKVNRLKEWIQLHEKEGEIKEIWAYADSESDLPLFNFVQHPIVVNPKDNMKEIAQKNQWPIFA